MVSNVFTLLTIFHLPTSNSTSKSPIVQSLLLLHSQENSITITAKENLYFIYCGIASPSSVIINPLITTFSFTVL